MGEARYCARGGEGQADQGATPDPTRRAPSFPGTLPRAMPLLAPDPSLRLARALPGQFKAPPVLPATQLQGVEAMALVKREARSSQFQPLSAHRAGTPTGATGTKRGAPIAPPSPKSVALSGRSTVLDRVWPLFWREDQLPPVRDRVLEQRCLPRARSESQTFRLCASNPSCSPYTSPPPPRISCNKIFAGSRCSSRENLAADDGASAKSSSCD